MPTLTRARRRRLSIANRAPVLAAGQHAIGNAFDRYMRGLQGRFMGKIVRTKAAGDGWTYDMDDDADWVAEAMTLRSAMVAPTTTTTIAGYDQQAIYTGIRFDLNSRGLDRVMAQTATRITNVSDETRDRVRQVVSDAADRDADYKTLARDLDAIFNDPARSMMISRTESAFAYNYGATANYRDSGLVDSCEVYDGSECGWTEHDDPDLADGSIRSLDECDMYPIAHPNCLRAFGPVVAGGEGEVTAEEPPAEEPPPEPAPPPEPEPVGLPDDVLAHLLANATNFDPNNYREAHFASGWTEMFRAYVQRGLFMGTEAEFKAAVEASMQAAVDDATPVIRRTSQSASKIIQQGRFKTQFETAQSGGMLDPAERAKAEARMFGYARDLDPTQRPVYGYLRSDAHLAGTAHDNARGYGDVMFDLRASTRARMTTTMDDSLMTASRPSPANDVRWSSAPPQGGNVPNGGMLDYKIDRTMPYAEVQVHGGVSLDDVNVVRFTQTGPDQATRDALRAAGFSGQPGAAGMVWERLPPLP